MRRVQKFFTHKLNVADWVSMFRIVAAPLLLVFIIFNLRYSFASLLLLCFLSDMLDGFIARKLKITSDRGAQIDSIADAITFCIAMVGIVKFEVAFIKEEYILVLLAFVPYLFQLIISYWRYGKPTSFHTYLAKIAAIFQGLFLLTLFFYGVVYWLFYIVIIISVIETIEEIILIFLHKRWRTNVKGLYWVIMRGIKEHI